MVATYLEALTASLKTVESKNPADVAAMRLAWGYAERLDDDAEALAKVGPLYLTVLTALGLTPAARAAAMKGGQTDERASASPLDELRERRSRKGGTSTMDSAVS